MTSSFPLCVSQAGLPDWRHLVSVVVVIVSLCFGVETNGSTIAAEPRQKSENALTKPAANALPTIKATTGWVTFGQALPRGAAKGGLRLGELETQTDVKTRWPDGSIRFAIVSAKVRTPGAYQAVAVPQAEGGFNPKIPKAMVRFRIDSEVWVADLPDKPSNDVWLNGPLVREWRVAMSPTGPKGSTHPFLRVIFDVRAYNDGQARLDVTVENTLDQAGSTKITYDIEILADGKSVFKRMGISHGYLARWRKILSLNLKFSEVIPDFEPVFQASALPRYLTTITKDVGSLRSEKFDLLQCGYLSPSMRAHGGRPELAPYPDWAANYIVHKEAAQKQFVLANGDLAGSWPIHLREPDKGKRSGIGAGRLVSIDERPDFWLDHDGRGDPQNKVAGDLNGQTPWVPDNAHVPSLAYVPYLVTGDRFYADEMAFWANSGLLMTFQDGYYNGRGGKAGLLAPNETRGIGWVLRNMADAAAYLPDSDPTKAYLAEKVANNLKWADEYAEKHRTPLGTYFEGQDSDQVKVGKWALPRPWMNNYVAWALDHAVKQGFEGGTKLRDKLVQFQFRLFTSQEYPRTHAAPYTLVIGTKEPNGKITYFTDLKTVFEATYGKPPDKPTSFDGYYGVDARLMLMIAMENGADGAAEAYKFLHSIIAKDLTRRGGWAIAPVSSKSTAGNKLGGD
jgi:hypothetical protein